MAEFTKTKSKTMIKLGIVALAMVIADPLYTWSMIYFSMVCIAGFLLWLAAWEVVK